MSFVDVLFSVPVLGSFSYYVFHCWCVPRPKTTLNIVDRKVLNQQKVMEQRAGVGNENASDVAPSSMRPGICDFHHLLLCSTRGRRYRRKAYQPLHTELF